MFASSTGMASSISCRSPCTVVTASIARGDPVSEAIVRWNRESACRCSAGLCGSVTTNSAACELPCCSMSERPGRGERGGAGLDDPAVGRARRASRRRFLAETRAAARADGVRGRRVTTVPPPRPRVVSTSPASRSAAMASRSVARETSQPLGELALGRAAPTPRG